MTEPYWGPEHRMITVVVCTYGRAAHLDRCLASLEKQTAPHELLVVYKPVEGDGAREILAKYKARVVEQTSSGIADARNLGLYGANTEFVAFIDDDCTAEPDWLMRLVEGMVAPNIGCVGGSAYGPDGVQFSGGWVDAYGRYKVVCSPPATGGGARFVNIVGMSCMFRRSDAVHVGGFDPYFNGFYEETDLAVRLAQASRRVVSEPLAIVYHDSAIGPRRHSKWAQDWYTIARNSAYMPYKNFGKSWKRDAILAALHARRLASYALALARGEMTWRWCLQVCADATRGYRAGLRDAAAKQRR